MGFAVVVDSTLDMSAEEYQALNITMVPLNILVGEDEFKDQVEISSEEFYKRMSEAAELPKTAQPAPFDFVQAYERLAHEGCEGIISLHIAGVLSGTVESARTAAGQVDVDVRVIDAACCTAQAALQVKQLCALRDAGATLDEAQAAIEALAPKTQFLVACDTLENLLKGGRLSVDQVKNASLLNIKPIFTFNETGVLVAFGKAKGMRGVIKQYVQNAQKRTEEQGKQRIRFCHVANEQGVEDLRSALDEAGVEYVDEGSSPCGATVATHLGLGALGIAFAPAES